MVDNQKTIATLAIILAAVVVVAALVVLWPASPSSTTSQQTSGTVEKLNTTVLQRSDYTQLNQQLIQQGALPVQPPGGAGKANPFL